MKSFDRVFPLFPDEGRARLDLDLKASLLILISNPWFDPPAEPACHFLFNFATDQSTSHPEAHFRTLAHVARERLPLGSDKPPAGGVISESNSFGLGAVEIELVG